MDVPYGYFGPVPCEENCQQLGYGYDAHKARCECRTWANQLRRVLETGGYDLADIELRVFGQSHEYGNYLEVGGWPMHDGGEDALDWLEDHCPATWDTEARVELGL